MTRPLASKSAMKSVAQATSDGVGLMTSLMTWVWSIARQSLPVMPIMTVMPVCSRRMGWLVPTVGPSMGPGRLPTRLATTSLARG